MRLAAVAYDPKEDIAGLLLEKNALDSVDVLLRSVQRYKLQLRQQRVTTNNVNNNVNNNVVNSVDNIVVDHDVNRSSVFDATAVDIFNDFSQTQLFAASTQDAISKLTKRISSLDNAKKNLIFTMNFVQNLKIIIHSYNKCIDYLHKNTFTKLAPHYKILNSLIQNILQNYKSIDQINQLYNLIIKLKRKIIDKVLKIYDAIISNNKDIDGENNNLIANELKFGVNDLYEFDTDSITQIKNFCIEKFLYEINEIFQINDEAGSLENFPRRYIYFKKILNNFNENFTRFFNDSWEMSLNLTIQFYHSTKTDLKLLLAKEFHNNETSNAIDLFMNSLQETLEFEKYIDVRFSKKLKILKISTVFEPYLSLWINHQNKLMNEKFLKFLSEKVLPESTNDSLIIPSSIEFFRTYRTILSQTLELLNENSTNDKILISLAKFFNHWLNEYLTKILKNLIIPQNVEIKDKTESIQYTLLLINTTDYCLITINQLEEKLVQLSNEPNHITKIFNTIKNIYSDYLSIGNNFLLQRILPMDLSYVWKEFNNIDWNHVMIEDYSRYMITLKQSLNFTNELNPTDSKKSSVQLILTQFNRDVYSWNFLDKIIDMITSDFINCIIRLLQPTPPFVTQQLQKRNFDTKKVITIAEQLLLDTELLKDIYQNLIQIMNSDATQSIAFKRVQIHADNNINQISSFLKLLVVTMNSPKDYYENYERLTFKNSNPIVWAFILSLKGANWDLEFWKTYYKEYENSIVSNSIPKSNNIFIFQWQPNLYKQFQNNLLRIQESSWKDFIRNDLKLSVTTPPMTKA